jgi:hypothetical protein
MSTAAYPNAPFETAQREANEVARQVMLARVGAMPDWAVIPRPQAAELIGLAPQTLANWAARQARGEQVPLSYTTTVDGRRVYRIADLRAYVNA